MNLRTTPLAATRRLMHSVLAGVAGLMVLVSGQASAQTQEEMAVLRKQFVAAYAAASRGPQAPDQPGEEALRQYPLYPYLQAARIRRSLAAAQAPAEAADGSAADFLKVHQGDPVASAVRRSWLESLAKREQWDTYLTHYRETEDPDLACPALTARINTGETAGLAPLIIKRWLSDGQLPPACERAFSWLREQGALTPELVEQRVRLILAKGNAGFARIIAQSLPAPRAAPLLQWAALIEQPRREIDALIANPGRPVEAGALLDGWSRLARSDLTYAQTRFAALAKARNLDAGAASPLALALALRLSWNRHPDAAGFFARVRREDFDDVGLEWRARTQLWSGDWKGVQSTLGMMPASLRDSARWRYWAARSAAAQGDDEDARELYVSVLGSDNYYSAMSAARLDRAYTPNPVPVAADESELKRIAGQPEFVRSRELLLADMRGEALAEWQAGLAKLPDESKSQVLHLGMRWGWYDVSIATATQQRIFDDYSLLYPRPYDPVVKAAVAFSRLPTELVYGVLRQESLYRADAVSSAGARGLLQLLPSTARLTARRWDHRVPGPAELLDPAINVRLGAAHLKELIDRFDGHVPIALASYNAGPNAALRWLPDTPLDTDIWIENIPYNETRTYIQRILWHSLVFSWLGSGQPQNTSHWLTQVSRAAPASAKNDCQAARSAEAISSRPLMMNCTPMQVGMNSAIPRASLMPVASITPSSRSAAPGTSLAE